MKKVFYGLFVVALSLILIACDPVEDNPSIVESIEITGPSEVTVGNQITLIATVDPSDVTVTWESSVAGVATVNNGVVTGIKSGTTVIKATAGDKNDTLTITVNPVESDVEEGVEPNTDEHTVLDTRVDAYVVHNAEGVKGDTHKSLYTAIEYVVNNESYGAYVTKASGEDSDFKLFTYNERFASDSEDMFYFYSKGNQLDTYTSWNQTYFQDLKDIGDAIAIQVSPALGVSQYFNSHKLVGVSSTDNSANSSPYWNVTTQIEASIAVNMIAYSGITKQEYDVKLTDSKIYPSMNEEQTTSAKLGFIVADANNTSNMGLVMDPKTGNWYYYAGETPWNWDGTNLDIDKDVTLMTSTWNESGYFVPNEDVNLTLEILTLTDNEGGEYVVDRLTMEFVQSGRTVVRDYEMSQLTQTGTIRFTATLDINSYGNLPDYMNGSKFENLVVTRAVAYALEEMQDVTKYGIIAELDAGEYDILNSNPETAARYQTIIYNPAVITTDFTTAGQDVYNFGYNLDSNNGAISHHIQKVIDLIEELPNVEDITESDKTQIEEARAAFNALNSFRNIYVMNIEVLNAAEMKLIGLVLSEDELAAVAAGLLIKELNEYADLNDIKDSKALIIDAYDKFNALSEEQKANVVVTLQSEKITTVYDFLMAVEVITAAELLEVINLTMWVNDYTFDGPVSTLVQFATLYEGLTEADFQLLPELTQSILNDPTKIQAFVISFGNYMTTYEFILDVMETYGVALDVTITVGEGAEQGEIVDTTAVDHDAIADEFAIIAAIWQSDVMSDSWNFRNNYAGRFDFVVEGGFAAYYPVLYSLLYNSEIYSYNWNTGMIDSQ